jgi:hypothetical protein
MKSLRSSVYQVSKRVTLQYGDRFTATGGPYWVVSDGTKLSLKSSGPYTFHCHVVRGAVEWIEALDKNGAFAVLHIKGRRKKIDASLVARPYRITGKKRPVLQRLDNRKRRA